MVPRTRFRANWQIGLGVLALVGCVAPRTVAGDGPWGRARVAYPTAYPARPCPTPTLGTFEPTPYMWVNGNSPAGGGVSPLGQFGDTNLSIYGPLSSLRSIAAPLQIYQRGYDGRVTVQEATSFSYPNLPSVGPVIYPTEATNYYGFRQSRTPPWFKSGELDRPELKRVDQRSVGWAGPLTFFGLPLRFRFGFGAGALAEVDEFLAEIAAAEVGVEDGRGVDQVAGFLEAIERVVGQHQAVARVEPGERAGGRLARPGGAGHQSRVRRLRDVRRRRPGRGAGGRGREEATRPRT